MSLHEPGWLWQTVVNGIAASPAIPNQLRILIYRCAGLRIPLGATIKPGTTIRARKLTLGRGTTLNYRCFFDNRAQVAMGARCGIGADVQFITSTHSASDPECRAGEGSLKSIAVGNGVWIGSRVTILPGVEIGDGCVIAAGAVVTRDCAPHGMYAGVPARWVKDLPRAR
jgi:maltose O-acetyltransferase